MSSSSDEKDELGPNMATAVDNCNDIDGSGEGGEVPSCSTSDGNGNGHDGSNSTTPATTALTATETDNNTDIIDKRTSNTSIATAATATAATRTTERSTSTGTTTSSSFVDEDSSPSSYSTSKVAPSADASAVSAETVSSRGGGPGGNPTTHTGGDGKNRPTYHHSSASPAAGAVLPGACAVAGPGGGTRTTMVAAVPAAPAAAPAPTGSIPPKTNDNEAEYDNNNDDDDSNPGTKRRPTIVGLPPTVTDQITDIICEDGSGREGGGQGEEGGVVDDENDNDGSPSLPVAEAYDEPPLISAEMVLPATTAPQPVQAVPVMYHVDIDEDHQSGDLRQYDDIARGSSGRHDDEGEYDVEEASSTGSASRKRHRRNSHQRRRQCVAFWIGAVLSCIVAIIIIVLAGTTRKEEIPHGDDDAVTTDIGGDGPNKTFPYPCFTNLLDILSYQIDVPEDELMNDDNPIIICPNTHIRIGNFRNPPENDFTIVDGDIPIQIMRPNVTIQCGLDGKRSNNCTVEGGLIQVITQFEYHHPDYGVVQPQDVIDGFTLRGMTFTGVIQGRFVFGGIPVTISHPGMGNRFEDCAWINVTATKRMMAIGQNYIMQLRGIELPELSADLTISNCLFQDNLYEEEFFVLFGQTLHVENSTFKNNILPTILSPGCGIHPNGCRNLIHAASGRNRCSVENVCIENFETMGAGPIGITSTTEWSSSGTNPWHGPVMYEHAGWLPSSSATTTVDGVAASNSSSSLPFCELGVAQFDTDQKSYKCLNESVFELRETGGCP
jgi:hypothetical protein